MPTRRNTPEEKAAWAAYMRDYRKKAKKPDTYRAHLPPTDRQLEILRIYADPSRGGSYAKVAQALGISTSAVHNQLGRLLRRLGVKTPTQAVYKLWVKQNEHPKPVPKPQERVSDVQSG